jgi:hypothetical protein
MDRRSNMATLLRTRLTTNTTDMGMERNKEHRPGWKHRKVELLSSDSSLFIQTNKYYSN